ncbi:mitochondrial import inner membrane translocase subunit Tim29 [Arctopsyche grandis]|uniref:mitochondrial import inner membrane translocase subunit Tim29 n=1 Tax=Arctopsyche grandis TaxID=121162 RepID=UPI00406D8F14
MSYVKLGITMSSVLKGSMLIRRASTLSSVTNKPILPEKSKVTFLEKWTTYWKSLHADYKSMVVDLRTEIQDSPRKAIFVGSMLVAGYQLAKTNPDESDFKESMRNYTSHMILIGDACRNPKTVEHFKLIERCYNQNTLRRLNLGLISFLWIDDYDSDCAIYKATCEYTKPSYLSIPGRIVDVGVMGRWWNIYRKFQDFDVNP